MPVVFNEPLSFLQRVVEYMEYAELIEKASNCNDPVERLEVTFNALLIMDSWILSLLFIFSSILKFIF